MPESSRPRARLSIQGWLDMSTGYRLFLGKEATNARSTVSADCARLTP